MIFVPPENETSAATTAITLLLLAPFETTIAVVGKYRVPVSCIATPPENVAFTADVIDLFWKNSMPMYGPDVSADRVKLAPLEMVTEP